MKSEVVNSNDKDAAQIVQTVKSLFPDLEIPVETLDIRGEVPQSFKVPFKLSKEVYTPQERKKIKRLYLDCCSEAHELVAEYLTLEKNLSLDKKPNTTNRWTKGAKSFHKTLENISGFKDIDVTYQELLGTSIHTFFSPDFNDEWAMQQGIDIGALRQSLFKRMLRSVEGILIPETISTIELILLYTTFQKYTQKKEYVSYSETNRRRKKKQFNLNKVFLGGVANPFSREIEISYFKRDFLRIASLLQVSIALLTVLATKDSSQVELFLIPAALFYIGALLGTTFSAIEYNSTSVVRKHEIIHQLQHLYTGKNGFKRY